MIWHAKIPRPTIDTIETLDETDMYREFLEEMIAYYGMSKDDLFYDDREHGCKTFVLAIDTGKDDFVRLRSYSSQMDLASTNCTIWQVAMAATTISPLECDWTDFQYIDVISNSILNPAEEALEEVSHIWRDQPICCFVSIGNSVFSPNRNDQVQSAILDPDQVAEYLGQSTKEANLNYFRFSVNEWMEMPTRDDLFEATGKYIDEMQGNEIISCSQLLLRGIEEWYGKLTLSLISYQSLSISSNLCRETYISPQAGFRTCPDRNKRSILTVLPR
jgi:hypothetical protein